MSFCRRHLHRWTAVVLLHCLLLGSLISSAAQAATSRGGTLLQDICSSALSAGKSSSLLRSELPSSGFLLHSPHCLFCLTPGDVAEPPPAPGLHVMALNLAWAVSLARSTTSQRASAFWERPLVRAPPLLSPPRPQRLATLG